jgi:dienelactone hydrolase
MRASRQSQWKVGNQRGELHDADMLRWVSLIFAFAYTATGFGQLSRSGALFFADFRNFADSVQLMQGARWETNSGTLAFDTSLQYAELTDRPSFDDIKSLSIGGWFFPRRSGEQVFLFRGLPEIGPLGERFFRRSDEFVNFILGTDQHGFLMGTINGNGTMPFAHVTVEAVPFDAWNQLVVVKDADGFQKFYRNGTVVHTDRDSTYAPKIWPFKDRTNQAIRLAAPLGGLIGEAWAYPRELTAQEIQDDFLAKRTRYKPALPANPVVTREMDAHFASGLWKGPITRENWPETRTRIMVAITNILGPFPAEKVALEPKVISETDCGNYIRQKVSIQVQANDRMPAYLLIPKGAKRRMPAVICFYGTSSGAGKETTVGLSGPKPGTLPSKNRDFAIDMVQAGFVAFAPDYLRDGERTPPSGRPYDTADFYAKFPNWSLVGKDVWDNMRAVDFLQTLPFVAPDKIGMVGHSYGGHSTIFATALEPRIKVAVANGPVSDFLHHGVHWGVPKGAGNSQSLPGLRPYVLDHTLELPLTFYEFTSLIAPRALWVGEAVGERRPMEEENHAAVRQVYEALGASDRVKYVWYAGDHDFPPDVRAEAVAWFRRWFGN